MHIDDFYNESQLDFQRNASGYFYAKGVTGINRQNMPKIFEFSRQNILKKIVEQSFGSSSSFYFYFIDLIKARLITANVRFYSSSSRPKCGLNFRAKITLKGFWRSSHISQKFRMGMQFMKIYVIAAPKPLKFDFSCENSKKVDILAVKVVKFPDLPLPTRDTKMAISPRVHTSAL